MLRASSDPDTERNPRMLPMNRSSVVDILPRPSLRSSKQLPTICREVPMKRSRPERRRTACGLRPAMGRSSFSSCSSPCQPVFRILFFLFLPQLKMEHGPRYGLAAPCDDHAFGDLLIL